MPTAAQLDGQVALVTGAGRGIGRAIALALAEAGARVVLAARSREQLEETAALARQMGRQALTFPLDITDQPAVEAMVAATRQQFGPPDLLVNNAGMANREAPLWELEADEWWRVLEVNLRGPFLCARAVLPDMLARGSGRIINVASNGGAWPIPTASAYSVSKAALLRLTDCLSEMVGARGLRVFAISPGTVHTSMTDGVSLFKDMPETDWSTPEQAAALCVTIASGYADRLAGRYLHVNDDLPALLRHVEEIEQQDLYSLRVRRLE